jgi:hypothetical protein
MVGSRWDVQVAIIARFKVLTVVLANIQVWDITPIYCLQVQGQAVYTE